MNKYAAFYSAYNASVKYGNPNSKEDTVEAFTEGRTKSLKDLSLTELNALTAQLNGISGHVVEDEKADKMRKAIISIFRKMGRTVQDAIRWAENQGVKGHKRGFNEYNTQELFVLIKVAEKVFADYQDAIRKSISKL